MIFDLSFNFSLPEIDSTIFLHIEELFYSIPPVELVYDPFYY